MTSRNNDLDDFLEELDTAEVHVGEEDLQSEEWDELEVPPGVRSLPDSIRGSSSGGSPAGSRSSPPPEAPTNKTPPAAASDMQGEGAQPGPAAGLASQPPPPAAAVPKPAPTTAAQPAGTKDPPSAGPADAPRQPAPGVPAAQPAAAAQLAAAAKPRAAVRPPAAAASGATPTPAQAALAAARARVAAAAAARTAAGAAGTKTAAETAAARPGAGNSGATASPPVGVDVAEGKQPAQVVARKANSAMETKGDGAEQAGAAGAAAEKAAAPAPPKPGAPASAPQETATATPPPAKAAVAAPAQKEDEKAQTAAEQQVEAESEGADEEERQVSGPVASGGGSHGKGWGGWGAIGKLGATLQAAATTAAKDVSELTESFQQVLQEIAQAPDEDDEEGWGEGGEGAEPGPNAPRAASQASSQRLLGGVDGSGAELRQQPDEGEWEELTPEQEARRRAVLAQLEGQDSKLGKSAKVLDAHVEQLSAGAGKALSSLWGWGATLAQKVEAAASTAAKELAETVQEAGPAWGSAASGLADAGKPAEGLGRLGGRLGQLGLAARELLEGGLQGPGRQSGSAAKDEAMSFEECFYVYGGQQAFEELEALSNECARLCNRVRSRLPEDDKANLDKILALLVPLFDLGVELPADSREGQGRGAPAEPAALARGHAMVADLAAAGCARADTMARAASQRAEELVALPPPPEEEPVAEGAATNAAAGAAAGAAAAPAGTQEQEGGAAVTQAVPEQREPSPGAIKALKGIQSEGVKRIAEVGALCIERLLALARSVSAQFRYGRPADDGISWPAEPEAKALLLRLQARKLLSDLEAVTESFVAALVGTGRSFNAHTADKVFVKLSKGLLPELGEAPAGSRVRDAYKALMYVVWLTSVDRELLE